VSRGPGSLHSPLLVLSSCPFSPLQADQYTYLHEGPSWRWAQGILQVQGGEEQSLFFFFLFIYSHVYTLFGSFLQPAPRPPPSSRQVLFEKQSLEVSFRQVLFEKQSLEVSFRHFALLTAWGEVWSQEDQILLLWSKSGSDFINLLLGVVAQSCDPCCLEGEGCEDHLWDKPWEPVRPLSQPMKKWAWW
jgi:hypothetical protein